MSLSMAGCRKIDNENPGPVSGEAVYLSKGGTANCYIVNGPGEYSFDATTMGNGRTETAAVAEKIAPVSAKLVWQDAKSLVSDIKLDNGEVRFKVTGDSGNALIAVYDDNDTVLWSWHIWVTGYNPYENAPKLNGMQWMDRNLGALSNDYDEAGSAKGMAYQWGRKDPFPSGYGWIDKGDIIVYDEQGNENTSVFQNVQVESETNLQNSIQNPTVYYFGTRDTGDDGPYDWYTTNASNMNDQLWENTVDLGKTMYDPCPPGWRVPRNGSWTGLTEANFIYDDAALGRRHALLGYYPSAGSRGTGSGEWSFVGGSGTYWSSSAANGYYVSTLNFLPGALNTHSNANRSGGCPVRCVSETTDEPDPVETEEYVLTKVTDASYIHMSGKDGSSNYYIGLSDVDFELVDGEQIPVEPGIIMYLDIYAAASEDQENAVLPEGTYTLDNETVSGTATLDYTWARLKKEDGSIAYYKPVDGKIKVKQSGSGYNITGTFAIDDSKEFTIEYDGELIFTDRSTENPSLPPLNEPVNATFSSAIATWEYRGDESERYTLKLLDGTLDGEVLTNGYLMTIDLLCSPGSTKDNMVLAEGTYSPSSDFVSPMTFTQGNVATMLGVPVKYGTYIEQVITVDEYPLTGFAEEGSIQIRRSGSQYEITVDVVTKEGVAVKGTFPMGDISFIDNSPITPSGDWLSVLTEDKTVVFNETDEYTGRVWSYGGGTEYEIMVDNEVTDEAFQLNFYVNEGDSYFGTFTTPVDPDNPQAGEFILGYKDLAVIRGTWPYLFYVFEESNYVGAPATEGSFEIKDLGDDLVEINIEMKDDAEPKNTIRSHWVGKLKKVNF